MNGALRMGMLDRIKNGRVNPAKPLFVANNIWKFVHKRTSV